MWIVLVWIISTVCYLPLYFERIGRSVPSALIQAKYLFVVIPIIFALMYVRRKTSIKKWLYKLFAIKIEIEAFVVCGIIAFCGILCTSIINIKAWNEISSLLGIVYLFFMAMLEEIAWRGFCLESMMKKKRENVAVLIVSLEWAIWHIPMWMIRNSLGIKEIALWLVYTILVGIILGNCMIKYKNILIPIILHTMFNVCFLMPITKSIIIVLLICTGVIILKNSKRKV